MRCVDADNLESIENFSIKSQSKKLEIKDQKNGVYQLIGLKKGEEITICAKNYHDEKYQRPDKRMEIAMKYNNEPLFNPGDTIVIELLLKSEILSKRWKDEDEFYSVTDTTNLESNPDTKPSLINEQEFTKILSSKLHFPEHVRNENFQGTVYISSIVELDGSLTNIEIIRSVEPHLDRIALRAVRSTELPKLNPATKDNLPVRSKIVIPLNFNLN